MSDSELSPTKTPAPTPPLTVRVWLLGTWRVLLDGTPLDLPAGQPRTLFIYLLLQPNAQAPRSATAEHLWHDVADDRKRRYLTDALYRLRRVLPPSLIVADAESVALDLTHTWWVDVWEVRRAAASPDAAGRKRCLELGAGDLVPDLVDAWITPHRQHLHQLFIQAAMAAAGEALRAGDLTDAESSYRRVLQADPLQEDALRGLMQTLSRRGRIAAALEEYDRFVDLLDIELGAPPSAETRELANHLYQELDLARRRQRPFQLRMVGRVEERTTLRALLDRTAQGQCSVAVILGEPGIGKSTLLRDLAYAVGWRGWQVCWGDAFADAPAAPYAPLTTALAKALPAVRASQIAAALPSVWINLLARLFPVLDQATQESSGRGGLPYAALDGSQLPQALSQLLHALQEVAPLLIVLDDVQWGDSALWTLLDALLPHSQQQRIFFVLSARRDDLQRDGTAWDCVTAWDRTGHAQIVALDGLPPADLQELALLHAVHGLGQPAATLHRASGGNPLLALELLSTAPPDQPPTARPAVATLVQQRLRTLDVGARLAAELAAILGAQVDYRVWEALWQRENPYGGDLVPHARALEHARVLRIEGDDYAFAHSLLHATTLAAMAPSVRQRRHAAALEIIAPPAGADGYLSAADVLRLLHHAQEAQDTPAIIRLAMIAARQAQQAFSFAGAETYFSLALDHLVGIDTTDPVERDGWTAQEIAARLGRVDVRHVLADRSGEEADLAALSLLSLDDEQTVAAEMRRARFKLLTGDLVIAQTTVDAAFQLAVRTGSSSIADIAVLAGKIARERNELALAYQNIQAAQEHYRQTDNSWGAAVATDLLGGVAWDQGAYARAASLHGQAADVFAALGDLMREAQALNNLGSALWELGRYREARASHERSVLVCRELGNRLSEGDNIDNLGGVAWVLGDYTLALHHYQAALRLREEIDDQWGVSISLSNLGSVYQMTGRYEEALDYYARSLVLSQQVGRKRSEAYIIHCQGQTRLAMGDLDAARELLCRALALRGEVGDRLRLIETHTLLLHTALARGEIADAMQQREAIMAMIDPADRAGLRQEVYFAAFCLAEYRGDPDARRLLGLALHAQREMADTLPPPDKARYLANVPLNRELIAAVARHSHIEAVTLAGSGGPVTVAWTIAHPEDELVEESAVRRRHVLARLLREAAAQQTVPTHEQLAAALNVSRRTILRDLPALVD